MLNLCFSKEGLNSSDTNDLTLSFKLEAASYFSLILANSFRETGAINYFECKQSTNQC